MRKNMSDAISITNLNFAYGRRQFELRDVSLCVPAGSIFGFLGPNGAGKTTTMRLLLGLLKNRQGEIRYFGKELREHRKEILYRVGSLIESPSLYRHLTAKENLEIHRLTYGCESKRIEAVLKTVGLLDAARRKVKTFSLGMKQRLGIALALLHDPDVLLLDEPTNGLDPAGMLEVRGLLKALNAEQGKTILMSSHLLDEVERTATHVGVLNKGAVVFQGPLEELMSRRGADPVYEVEVDNPAAARGLLPAAAVAGVDGNVLSVRPGGKEGVNSVVTALVNGGVNVYGVSARKNDLEDLFLELTKW